MLIVVVIATIIVVTILVVPGIKLLRNHKDWANLRVVQLREFCFRMGPLKENVLLPLLGKPPKSNTGHPAVTKHQSQSCTHKQFIQYGKWKPLLDIFLRYYRKWCVNTELQTVIQNTLENTNTLFIDSISQWLTKVWWSILYYILCSPC